MLKISKRTLKILAALIWYIGGIILALKARSLLIEATNLRPGLIWPWGALASGLLLGALKARYIFINSCRKNITRINAMREPRIWQFYSPRFFLLLTLMISAGGSCPARKTASISAPNVSSTLLNAASR